MMEKIKMKREQTSKTFDMEGIEAIRAMTTNFIPSSLEITLSGLKARNDLKAFSNDIVVMSTPANIKAKSTKEATTTKKSS